MSFIDLNNIEEKEIISGYNVRFVHSENMTFAFWKVKEGASLPEHSHFHEQVACVVEGEFELNIEGNKQVCKPGSVAIIPPNAKHSGKAITDCRLIDTFYPVREDYK